jgi:tetratricopeptide (TPR) repeat protein
MRDSYRWVLTLPVLVFGTGVWLYFQTQNEARAEMARAQEKWRLGAFDEAVRRYESIRAQHPHSRYADDALWEIGAIYYFNYYDINRALDCFQRITAEYPGTPLATQSRLKLAEIHEVALGDLPGAVGEWKKILVGDSSFRLRQQVLFKIATAYMKMDRFSEALQEFENLSASGEDEELACQASNRAGAVLQIMKDHAGSLRYFQSVVDRSTCSDCRTQAKLGLIESYEFLDELPKAIEVARSLTPAECSDQIKGALLKRLNDKHNYYGTSLWNAR